MTTAEPTILATSGGYKPGERLPLEFNSLVHYAVELAGTTGRAPRIAHLGTAGGDQRYFNAMLSDAAGAAGFDLMHLNLFPMPAVDNMAEQLLEQDVVWVNGGSVANLLAVWRVHDLDRIFRKVWESGVGLLYRGTELVEVLSERKGTEQSRPGGYVVTREGAGAREEPLQARYLG